MIPYKNMNCFSPIASFDYGEDWIKIEWFSGEIRTFQYNDVGKRHIEQMVKCAKKGKGLSTYIEKYSLDFKTGKNQ